MGIYHDSRGFQPVSWGGSNCGNNNTPLNLSSIDIPSPLEKLYTSN